MYKRNFITGIILLLFLSVSVDGQNNTKATKLKALKDAYTGKFLIGTASDLQ